MNGVGKRILGAPLRVRRGAGSVVLIAIVVVIAVSLPAAAAPGDVANWAGSGECANVDTGDQGAATASSQVKLHGQTLGVQLASAGGVLYVGDVFLVRAIVPPGASVVYRGQPDTDLIRGVAAGSQGVVWVDTKGQTVRVRTLSGVIPTTLAVDDTTRYLEHGVAVATDGSTYFTVPHANRIYKVVGTSYEPVTHGPLTGPGSLAALDEGGKTILYVAGKGSRVMRVDPATGETTPVGGTLSVAQTPARVAADTVDKQLYVSDLDGLSQIDLPSDRSKSKVLHELPGGQITGLAVVKASAAAKPLVVFANQGVPTGEMGPNPNYQPGRPGPSLVPVERCDLQSVVPYDPVPPTSSTQKSSEPTTPPSSVPDTTPTTVPKLGAPSGDGVTSPSPNQVNEQVTDPAQLAGSRAEGDFGQFNPFVGSGPASANSSFIPSLTAGGQGFSGFAPGPAATDPFSGGGALVGTGPGPAETVTATGAGPPDASVANPGPVGAVAPLPAASSPTPVQGWAGAPGPPAQGATRYAMVAEEQGRNLVVPVLLGIGGCFLLVAVGAGTRRGGKAAATATAPAPARAWAVGR